MSEQNKLQGTGEEAVKDPSETQTVSLKIITQILFSVYWLGKPILLATLIEHQSGF